MEVFLIGVDAFFIYKALGLIVGVMEFILLRSGEGDCKGRVVGITRKSISVLKKLVRIR